MAKMLVPETEVRATEGKVAFRKNDSTRRRNFIVLSGGTHFQRRLALNVAIMLISFLALVALPRPAVWLGPRPQ